MGRLSGRWLGIGVAVALMATFALCTTGGGSSKSGGQAISQTSADAQAPTPMQSVQVVSPKATVGLVLKIGLVAGLLGVSLWALKRFGGAATRSGGRTGAVSVVDTIALAQNRTLYVLDIGDRAVVVGATPQQFTPLAEVTDACVLERLRSGPPKQETPINGLAQSINAFMQRATTRQAGFFSTPAQQHDDPPHDVHLAGFAETLAEYDAPPPPSSGLRRRYASAPVAEVETAVVADPSLRLRQMAERLRTAREPA